MKVKPFYIQITDDMTPQMVQDAFDKCVDAGAVAANGCKGVMSKFHYQGNFDVSLYSVFGVNAGFGTYIEESSDYFDDNAQEITLDQLDEWLGINEDEITEGNEMSYKTFEDMKHNIPEGATHYSDECDDYHFTWFKYEDNKPKLLTKDDGFWVSSLFERNIKQIPQTETPEEKEVFDSMANNSELPNSSEWKYGDKAEWTSVEFIYVAQHPTRPDRSVCIHLDHGSAYSILTCELKKPETPKQREERERLENGRALFELVQGIWSDVDDRYEAHPYDSQVVDDVTKELYARLASELNYRKAK